MQPGLKPTIVWDLLCFAGVGLLALGLSWMYAPLGVILIGGCMIAAGILGARTVTKNSARPVQPTAAETDDAADQSV